ncbi:hypothetical protein B0T22DRAFT_519029 [Podospora appendiculata]|uniref:Iron-sulfur assembly protein 1 n=1 Tax=Podospora appendiculata TaxID=314037 RepID=A0AAE0X2H6_9PEZI|nr:hypothetical protein B0T22DRAFT_519029 [Podospora appendiculata]
MNTPTRLLTRRTASSVSASASVCFSCRRDLLRQFSTTRASAAAAFQSYSLPSHPPPSPRNASANDTSISRPIQSPPLPKVHETRPPKNLQSHMKAAASAAPAPEPVARVSIPEQVAQQQQQAKPSAATPAQTQTQTQTSTPAPAPKPRSKLRTPRKAAMKLTPTAVEHLRDMLDQPDPKLIKVGVRNRGCSGLAYHLEYVDKASAFDEAVEQDGVKVLIDSKALFSIIGSEMDWVEDKLSQRFVFRNPNIKEQCGCGESFMV